MRFWQCSVKIFNVVMIYWNNYQIGVVFFFQIKFCIEDGGVKIFDGYCVQIQSCYVEQEVIDVEINLFCYLFCIIMQIFMVYISEEFVIFIVCGFCFWCGKVVIGIFLVNNQFQLDIVYCGFCIEYYDV